MSTQSKALLTLALVFSLLALWNTRGSSFGGAPAGVMSTIATTTLSRSITTSQSLLFASSTCASRVITTTGGGIYLTFSDVQGIVPTATTGHFQAASSTVLYDGDLYGCNAFRAISATGATVVVSVSESR